MRKQHKVPSALLLAILIASSESRSMGQAIPELVSLPRSTTALEGRPNVVVTSEDAGTEKRVLTPEEARKNRLLVTVVNGQFFWASRDNRQLELSTSGAFTYLSGGPGSYVKFTRLGTRIVYMEHATILLSTVTYWGELDVVTGK